MGDPSAVSTRSAAEQFVDRLGELSESDLKTLRNAAGGRRGDDVRVYDIFTGLFRPLRRKHIMVRWAYYLVATLYPWHPGNGPPANLGAAMRRLRPPSREKDARDRADRRFRRLLDSKGRDLGVRLLECVRMLRREGIPVDWPRLIEDLSQWYRGNHKTQYSWAEEYFR